jgi:hypothetical protein
VIIYHCLAHTVHARSADNFLAQEGTGGAAFLGDIFVTLCSTESHCTCDKWAIVPRGHHGNERHMRMSFAAVQPIQQPPCSLKMIHCTAQACQRSVQNFAK